jgi:glucan 1,4-alpha-glucosidase
MRFYLFSIVLILLTLWSCQSTVPINKLTSPDQSLQLTFDLDDKGRPTYTLSKNNKMVIAPSVMGFLTKTRNYATFKPTFTTAISDFDDTWKTVWGQSSEIRNHYHQMEVALQGDKDLKMKIIFRLYDDGLGFRYVFEGVIGEIIYITDELTEFTMPEDPTTWWVPGCWDNDEYPYTESKMSAVDASFFQKGYKYSNVTTITHRKSVNTPVTMKLGDGTHVMIHEAALVEFPGMSMTIDSARLSYKSHLAKANDSIDYVAKVGLSFMTPWRTIHITKDAASLLASNLILNLNEPSKILDPSWIKPTKYAGIWWEMHVGKAAWDLKSGKHGANNDNVKAYIDFCAANEIPAVLIEGWNTGWEQWIGDDREGIFDFVTPYPDFNFTELAAYAKSKNVEIIGHHETASAVETYEKHMKNAYEYYNKMGVKAVKTGYVGKIPGHRHYDQYMVNHYNKTMMMTADHKIMLNIHEPIKPTGLSRTYPHLMSAEGMRGQEFNAWSDGNKPSHNVTLPFTRNMAGPMDFTPGIFDLKLEKYKNNITQVSGFDTRDGDKPYSRVYSTLAHQLGLYVVFYSPIQMAADLPENYKGHAAFQFIRDVAVDWDWTKIIEAEVASHVITVRKEKNQDRYFIGGITGDKARSTTIKMDFLPKGKTYTATIYKDASTTDHLTKPEAYEIEKIMVTQSSVLNVDMKAAGGFAISILP